MQFIKLQWIVLSKINIFWFFCKSLIKWKTQSSKKAQRRKNAKICFRWKPQIENQRHLFLLICGYKSTKISQNSDNFPKFSHSSPKFSSKRWIWFMLIVLFTKYFPAIFGDSHHICDICGCFECFGMLHGIFNSRQSNRKEI